MSTVEQAATWARELTRRESRGPGDIEASWRRLARRYGVPLQMFWRLRYRPPKTVSAEVYLRLCGAYRAECDRQMRKLAHELDITEAIAGPDHHLVASAATFVCEADNET